MSDNSSLVIRDVVPALVRKCSGCGRPMPPAAVKVPKASLPSTNETSRAITPSGEPRFFALFTNPRTASNLLIQMLNLDQQDNVISGQNGGYWFYAAAISKFNKRLFGPYDTWTDEERETLRAGFETAYLRLLAASQPALAEGSNKTMLWKEHSGFLTNSIYHDRLLYGEKATRAKPYTVAADDGMRTEHNWTVLPDNFLLQWMPTFLIRHPAVMYPSHYRALRDLNKLDDFVLRLSDTMIWARKLYNFYEHNMPSALREYKGVTWPVVIEADDVILRPQVVHRFAALSGLDEQKLRFEWEPLPWDIVQSQNHVMNRMFSTIQASTGVIKGKTADGLDIEKEIFKWTAEFGPDAARKIESFVRAAMPDYEFMKSRRLRTSPSVIDGRRV